ncbi:MAG: hypothetical protein E7580_07705 [Ruminococcaceae bacterium]|nr:hypothetical protein [Oscillospiraceae bacterium]
MKKQFLFGIIAVLMSAFIGACVYMVFFKKADTLAPVKEDDDTVGTFKLEEFSDDIEWYVENEYFPKEDVPGPLGFIDSPQTAKEMAEIVFLKVYGEKTVQNRKPFSVSFDEENQVYLIQGTLPDNIQGGIPEVLIRKSDGKVIAVWNYK